jgi:hypothetical protein
VRELAYPFEVTVIDPDKFSIQVAEPATASGWGGGASVRITGRGYLINSAIQNNAAGARCIEFTACWFNNTGVYGQKYFAGRWMEGARFHSCRLGYNDASKLPLNPADPPAQWRFAPEDPAIYFDTANWTPAGALGSLPLFFFENCSFGTKLPASVTDKVHVGFNGYMTSIGESVQVFEYPGFIHNSTADGVTAAGNTQGTARTIRAEVNNVTESTPVTAFCVKLPPAAPGRRVLIWNNSENPINIYPGVGSSISPLAENMPLSNFAVGQNRTFRAISATKWLTE